VSALTLLTALAAILAAPFLIAQASAPA